MKMVHISSSMEKHAQYEAKILENVAWHKQGNIDTIYFNLHQTDKRYYLSAQITKIYDCYISFLSNL